MATTAGSHTRGTEGTDWSRKNRAQVIALGRPALPTRACVRYIFHCLGLPSFPWKTRRPARFSCSQHAATISCIGTWLHKPASYHSHHLEVHHARKKRAREVLQAVENAAGAMELPDMSCPAEDHPTRWVFRERVV